MSENIDAKQEPVLVDTETCDNGIRLEILDAGRPLAGDGWLVAAVFRLVVPVASVLPAEAGDGPGAAEVRRLIGDPVVFEKRLERTFIKAARKHEVLHDMVRHYLDGVRAYLRGPKFARAFVLKRYAEAVRKARRCADRADRLPPG